MLAIGGINQRPARAASHSQPVRLQAKSTPWGKHGRSHQTIAVNATGVFSGIVATDRASRLRNSARKLYQRLLLVAKRLAMKNTIVVVVGVIALLGAIGGGLTGYFFWRFAAHIPEADYPEPADAREARLQDLDYLRHLPQIDKSFTQAEEAELDRHITQLEEQVDALSEAQFLMELAAGAAITENGHTGASYRDLFGKMNSLPVRFYWFAEGLFIVRAQSDYAALLGKRVARYGGHAPDDLVSGLDPYHSGNDAFLRHESAMFFNSPEAMHAAGLIEKGEALALELVDTDGSITQVNLTAETRPSSAVRLSRTSLSPLDKSEIESEADGAQAWVTLAPEATEATWFGRLTETPLWRDTLPGGGIYWRMRDVVGTNEQSAADWLELEASKLREERAEFLVLDLRTNVGRNYLESVDVMTEITDLIVPDGRIYVLTDNATFSAGVVTAALALHGGGEQAVMVGAEMGDDGQFWAEGGGPMVLPNSDMWIFVATGYHDWGNGCTSLTRCFWPNVRYGVAAGPLTVDLPAAMRFADYSQGIDTGIKTILEAEAAHN